MSNAFLMWASFAVPWFTLVFMKKEDIKRLMPVALVSTVTSIMIYDIGLRIGLWSVRETFYPFNSLSPSSFGVFPVITMWVFRFTYGNFGIYMLLNAILDVVFNFFILSYFLPSRGISDFTTTPILTLPITLIHAVVLYGYQLWQEDVLVSTKESTRSFIKIPSAVAKPLPQNEDDHKDKSR